MLPCLFIFFVLDCCNLCICWDGYVFWFYMGGVFLLSSLLLRTQW
jgi:hypothetical protein